MAENGVAVLDGFRPTKAFGLIEILVMVATFEGAEEGLQTAGFLRVGFQPG